MEVKLRSQDLVSDPKTKKIPMEDSRSLAKTNDGAFQTI